MLLKKDVIVVGQGIAGSCVAHELLAKGLSVAVIDNNHQNSSSMVAAGLINPIVFKRLTKSWKVDDLLPAMKSLYKRVEEKLDLSIINPIQIAKLFTSIQEQNQWFEKSDAIGFADYLGEVMSQDEMEGKYEVNAPFGVGVVKNSCYIDLPSFLLGSRKYFEEIDSLVNAKFSYDQLLIEGKLVKYNSNELEIEAESIVFCEGHKATENPYFKELPFNLAKGEVIEFKHESLKLDNIINKNGFVLPTKSGTFKLGATYEWKQLDEVPTEEGKNKLLEKLSILKNPDIEIVKHWAGVRPTVKDRRPLIGTSEEYNNVHIFNGMGTKGALIAPFYAKHFVEHLTSNIPLEAEVDIKRYSKIE